MNEKGHPAPDVAKVLAGEVARRIMAEDRAARQLATAVERSRTGRSGLYDITIAGQDGTVIAEFRGHSRTVGGHWLDGS